MSNYMRVFGQAYVLGQQATAFDNEIYSDCEVHVGTKRFKVAKFVLGLHSEVFYAAFFHNTIEKQNNVIKIDDLDAILVEKMLRYMYTGVVDDLDNVASELYVVADRYAVHTLKDLCHLALFENLRVENILHCLELLHTFDNLKRFKPKTLQFVTNNLSQIIALPAWKDFCADHGNILREILEVTANNRPEVPQKQMRLDVSLSQNTQYSSQPATQLQYRANEITEDFLDPEVQILNPPVSQLRFSSTDNTFYPFQQNVPYSQQSYQPHLGLNWSQNQQNNN